MRTLIVASVIALAASPAFAAEDAKALFEQRCAKCHGEDGKGETKMGKKGHAPDFTRERWQKHHGDEAVLKAITEGVVEKGKRRMPAFKDKLSEEQITALAGYVRSFGAAPAQKPADGAADKPAEKPADGSAEKPAE